MSTIKTLEAGLKYVYVNNKDTTTTLSTYLTHFLSVSVVDIQQVNVCWDIMW